MFGKKKTKKQAASHPQQMQVSPEALALLQAMQAQQMQQQMMQQQMMMQQPQMQQPQMQQPMMQQPQMQQPMMQQPQMQQPMMQQSQMPPAMPEPVSDGDLLAELGVSSQPISAQPIAAQQQMAPTQMGSVEAQASPDMMAQTAMQAEAAPMQASGFPFATTQPAPAFEDEGDVTVKAKKKGKLRKDEKRILAEQKKADKERKKAEKKALIAEKAEEKKRAKRRKKLAKTRFSRARYLREASGNAVAGVVLWVFLIIIFIAGPFVLNTALLIPQTNENLRIISEADSLKRSIKVNQPQITAMVEKRKTKKGQINAFVTSFPAAGKAQAELESLTEQLETAGLDLLSNNITPAPLAAQAIIGTAVTLEVQGNYLDWLRVRNKFVRAHRAISIPNESVRVNNETGQMEIAAQIILPSARN